MMLDQGSGRKRFVRATGRLPAPAPASRVRPAMRRAAGDCALGGQASRARAAVLVCPLGDKGNAKPLAWRAEIGGRRDVIERPGHRLVGEASATRFFAFLQNGSEPAGRVPAA